MFTSRAENRLMLRHDTSDSRLSPYGRYFGLLDNQQWILFSKRRDQLAQLRNILLESRFRRSDDEYHELSSLTNRDLGDSISLAALSRFPDIKLEIIFDYLPSGIKPYATLADLETVIADLLYEGYLQSQNQINNKIKHHDNLLIPTNLNYSQISGLSNEVVERLNRARPFNFGDVRRIPGISHGALSVLLFYLKNRGLSS